MKMIDSVLLTSIVILRQKWNRSDVKSPAHMLASSIDYIFSDRLVRSLGPDV